MTILLYVYLYDNKTDLPSLGTDSVFSWLHSSTAFWIPSGSISMMSYKSTWSSSIYTSLILRILYPESYTLMIYIQDSLPIRWSSSIYTQNLIPRVLY